MLDDVLSVWTPGSILVAFLGGLTLGLAVTRWPALVAAKRSSGQARPGLVVALLLVWVGGVFYAGQIVEALLSGDPLYTRIVSRSLLWLVYGASVGTGIWLGLRRRTA